MTIQVRGPDGATINFPDGTPNAVMQRAMSQHYNTGYSRARGEAEKALGASTVGKGVLNSGAQGASFGFLDELGGGLAAAKTAAQNALARTGVVKPAGYGASDAYHATVDADRARMAQFHQAHPVIDTAAQVGGALLAPGVGLGGRAVARGTGLLAPLAENTLARSALVGGAIGAAQGAGNAQGGVGSRLKGAATGGALGAATGAAVPLAGATISGAVKGVAAPVVTTVARAANKASGGKLLDPAQTAIQRLTSAMMKDGATPDAIRAAQGDWLKAGGVTPSTMDLATKLPNGGQHTMALLRGAAMQGAGRGVAVGYGDKVAADLQDAAIARTRALTPDTRPAAQVVDDLTAQRAAKAEADYAGPYATPIKITPEVANAVADAPGQRAVKAAMQTATVRQDYPQVKQLANLQGLDVSDIDGFTPEAMARVRAASVDQAEPITAGALDRVRIEMANMGKAANETARTRAQAGGFFDRAGQLDAALEGVPELQPARAAYKDDSGRIDAVDAGQGVLNATPDDFSASFDPAHAPQAAIGARQALTDAIGRPAEGATGVLNRISTATNTGRNLASAFGDDAAGDYQQSIGQMVDQMGNARFLNPNTGSQTAGRLADEGMVEHIPLTHHGMIAAVINKLRSGATLTDGEREHLVGLGVNQDPQALNALLSQFRPPKADPTIAPWLTPRVAAGSADLMATNGQ